MGAKISIMFMIAGFAKAIMDTLQFHYSTSIFSNFKSQFWDPSVSWQNKYSNLDTLTTKKLFWIIPYPVFLTDAWHLFQFIFLNSIFLGIFILLFVQIQSIQWIIITSIAERIVFGLSFWAGYNILLKK